MERIDVLVNLTGLEKDETVMLRDLATGWDGVMFRGTGVAGPSYTAPAPGSKLTTIAALSGPAPRAAAT